MQSGGPGYLLHQDTRQLQESSQRVELSTEISPFTINFKTYCWGFPGSSVVKNPPASAENTGLIPEPGRFHVPQSNKAHAPQPLNLCCRARETQLLKPTCSRACAPQQKKPLQWEAHAATREKATWSTEDPAQPKTNKQIKFFFNILLDLLL